VKNRRAPVRADRGGGVVGVGAPVPAAFIDELSMTSASLAHLRPSERGSLDAASGRPACSPRLFGLWLAARWCRYALKRHDAVRRLHGKRRFQRDAARPSMVLPSGKCCSRSSARAKAS